MKVLLTWYADQDETRRIRAALPPDTELFVPPERPHLWRYELSYGEVADAARDADAIMGWVLPNGTIAAAGSLKALVWLHAGCDELDFEMLKRRGIQVANVRGANGIAVAEHAIAFMLGLAKRLVPNHQAVIDGRFQPIWYPDGASTFLEGKTLVVVGLGEIGAAVAKRAQAFDMRVLAVRRHPEKGGPHVETVYGPADLHEVLAQADFTVLAAPLTGETFGFIDDAALAAMKPTAFLINVARGNLISERALHAALEEGRLAGFAADVWWKTTNAIPVTHHFPTPSRTGLHKLPIVLASGDRAANIMAVKDRMIDLGTESLAAFLRGEAMPRGVNLDLGY